MFNNSKEKEEKRIEKENLLGKFNCWLLELFNNSEKKEEKRIEEENLLELNSIIIDY